MSDDFKKQTREYRLKTARACFTTGDFVGTLEWLGEPSTKADKVLASECHYVLMKVASAKGELPMARSHAARVIQLNTASRATLFLAAERLKLLSERLPQHTALPPVFRLGEAVVEGVGPVIVLGEHGTRGRPEGLAPIVLLLKKSAGELDEAERQVRPQLLEAAGKGLSAGLRQARIAERIDFIVPIPTDPGRFVTRGFSQQELLSRALSDHCKIPLIDDLLIKTRETRDLRGLSSGERTIELADSMAIAEQRQHLVKSRVILLLDDVVTYGTHIREAKRVLLEGGAVEVDACALATARQNFESMD